MFKISLFLLCWCTLSASKAQNLNFCSELKKINTIVETKHYQPKPLNDSLAKGVIGLFLDEIDERKRFFTKADIELFKKDELQIDDYIKNKSCDFTTPYAKVLKQRISDSKQILELLKEQPLDYSGVDSLRYNADKDYSYFKSKASVTKYWSKKVRFKILTKLVENDSVLERISSNFTTLETSVKQKIIDNEICLLNELESSKGSIENFVNAAFLNAFLKYQDPNSIYLSNSDKNLFEESVSNSQLSFGIKTIKKKNGDIIIAHIVPGSSAFKHGGFEINDVIITLKSTETSLDTYCTSNETVTSFINDGNIKSMAFKIKKQSGQIKTLKLTKSKVNVEGNSITGYLLEGGHTIGYINIPSFYTDLESLNGLGVSNDVAKQIYKLQRAKIAGLIIDLRFNGGGSMKEAADLSGMFIDRGPVAISKVRDVENYTIRDPNRGTVFKKPIIILVDQFSASASEFFASAMQDYNAAIIIGSTTHGKATSQVILPVGTSKSSGFVKLTTGQFFRVTGNSHQKSGIVPDIVLPSIYDNYKTQEHYKPFVLESNSVEVTLKHKPKPKRDLSILKSNCIERINNSSMFNTIKAFNTIFVEGYINRTGTYPLTLDFVFKDITNYNTAWKDYSEKLEANTTIFKVNNTASTEAILAYNEDDTAINIKYRKTLEKDPYIQEAYLILNDIFQL